MLKIDVSGRRVLLAVEDFLDEDPLLEDVEDLLNYLKEACDILQDYLDELEEE